MLSNTGPTGTRRGIIVTKSADEVPAIGPHGRRKMKHPFSNPSRVKLNRPQARATVDSRLDWVDKVVVTNHPVCICGRVNQAAGCRCRIFKMEMSEFEPTVLSRPGGAFRASASTTFLCSAIASSKGRAVSAFARANTISNAITLAPAP